MWIIFTAFLCSVAFCTATRQEYGLCSQVYLMSQYCSNNDVTPLTNAKVARGPAGKPGIPGRAGPRGMPGVVNVTNVDKTIAAKIKEVEIEFESKFKEYEIVMNNTVLDLEKRLEKLEIKFAECEATKNKTSSNEETKPSITDCHEAKPEQAKVRSGAGGVFDVYPPPGNSAIEVFCDLTTDGGGWTVFQRRFDGSQDFNQDWRNYAAGFGDLTGEFWLGLEKLHLLTQDGGYELRIELIANDGRIGIATYQTFSISGSSENYELNVGGFSGTGVGDALTYHNNMAFTTKDRDNDNKSKGNCAVHYQGEGGGWWFNNCSTSRLNNIYGSIYWNGFSKNIKKAEMKFRKK